MSQEHLANHAIIESAEARHLDEERAQEQRMFDLLSRFGNTIVLVFAIEHGKTLRDDTTYFYHFLLFTFIIIVSYTIETKVNSWLNRNRYGIRSVLLFIKSIAEIVTTYFLYIVVNLLNQKISSQADDEPWSYSKLIGPAIMILFIQAIPLIVNLKFYEPITRAKES